MSNFLTKLPDNIEYADQALTDLKEIWFHIATDNEDYANKTIIGIIETIGKISTFPKMGKTRDSLLLGLRSFPSGRFVIFYQETDIGIEVVRVIHGSREIESVFDEMLPDESIN